MHDWTKTGETTVIDCPEFVFELGEFVKGADKMVFAHLTVHKWSLSVLKRMLRDFAAFRKHVTCPLYAVGSTDDEKWAGFVGLLGFKFLTNVICENGEQRRLFISLKEPQSGVKQTINNQQRDDRLDDQPVGRAGSIPDAGVSGSLGRP